MVSIVSLAIPILLSAVFVFLASSIIHMVLKYHQKDFNAVPNEDGLLEAFRRLNVTPGDYCMPYAGSMEAMKSKEFSDKFAKGPVVTMTVSAGGPMNMGGQLMQWFLYAVVISIFTAYLTGRVLPAGAELPRCVSSRRHRHVHGLRDGAAADFDLVQAQLGLDVPVDGRWPSVRAADRGHLRMAVALGTDAGNGPLD